ncbi:MAG: AAA family ATPase [Candidatus Auribacterota bacterium]|jgi:general secretion pathway protein A|nr:AAA family ATPase [Candidatus Auribacterota bacterium]
MYKDFFGLKENPFDLTPDSHFLFPSKKHQEALAHLTYGIEARKGFILITGEVGAGKTTLCRALLSRMNTNTEVAFVLNSYLNAFEILQAINEDLGIKSKAKSKKELVDELNEFLLEQKQRSRNVVVLIDECQNLPFETLEQLRMLSNLETEKEKLLQIVMVGQPELLEILNTPELRQLNQRITVRYHLYPLDYHEMTEYIEHRLKVAGSESGIEFTPTALKRIFKYSRGVPRIVNVVCDNTLLAAYVSEKKKITLQLVNKAIKEIQGKKPLKQLENRFFSLRFSLKRVFKYSFIGSALLIIVLFTAYFKDLKDSISTYSGTLQNMRRMYESTLVQLNAEQQKVNILQSRPIEAQLGQVQVITPQPPTPSKPDNPSIEPVIKLLDIWNVNPQLKESIYTKYRTQDSLPLEKIALSAGLSRVESWADIDTLLIFNLPVLLEVSDSQFIRKYLLLKKINGDQAVVVNNDGEKNIGLPELKKIFIGSAVLYINKVVNSDEIFYPTSEGVMVEQIQEILLKLAYYRGKKDGKYSESLAGAVKKFQSDKGLNPDGIVDINTLLALYGSVRDDNSPKLR